jgi:flagellar motor switch protein FliN/FliY
MSDMRDMPREGGDEGEDFDISAEEQGGDQVESEMASDKMAALYDVPVDIQVVLGTAQLPVNQLLKLGRGAVVEIDRKVGEAVDIHVNNHLVARGEVVIVEDNRLGVTLTEIVRNLPSSG